MQCDDLICVNYRFKCERQNTKLFFLEGILEDIFIFEKDIKDFFKGHKRLIIGLH